MVWKGNKHVLNTFTFRPQPLHGNSLRIFTKHLDRSKARLKNTPNEAASHAAL